jgi:hypothetical protein
MRETPSGHGAGRTLIPWGSATVTEEQVMRLLSRMWNTAHWAGKTTPDEHPNRIIRRPEQVDPTT